MGTLKTDQAYLIETELYSGPGVQVLRGKHIPNDAPVVLKMLSDEFASAADEARLRREFEITKRFDFPGVVRALEFIRLHGKATIVFEDRGCITLKAALAERKTLRLRAFLKIAVRLAKILSQIHATGIIHRDIKPGNIFLNPTTGEVQIADFGIASELSGESQAVIAPDRLEGTLEYISPEQTGRMNRGVDFRTDLYSLGVTLYEMLIGAPPFRADTIHGAADPMEIIHGHIARPAPRVNTLRPELPAVIGDIIARLLEKNAELRYQAANGLRDDLLRCARELRESGTIKLFAIGATDHAGRLQIPEKLYGRQTELNVLLGVFERIHARTEADQQLLLITGHSGIGKSTLIHEIHRYIPEHRGFFVSGKFDQLKRSLPYSAVIQAFQELVRMILTERDEVVDVWRQRLRKALDPNARLIAEVLPEIELLLPDLQAVPELPPTEARNRFDRTLLNFIDVFAAADHPLVLFLDDLQWADGATLRLIETLFANSAENSERSLFLIGAYRDNEVDEHHPLAHCLAALNREIEKIHLGPLTDEHIRELIADTFSAEPERAAELAGLVHRRTNGNPFYINEFLKSLDRERLVRYAADPPGWRWELASIEQQAVTDNVVDFLTANLRRLPERERHALSLAALIGNRFDLGVLSKARDEDPTMTLASLWPAVQNGYVCALDQNYRLFQAGANTTNDATDPASADAAGPDARDVRFRFAHDRIQQAAASLIPEAERGPLHISIAQTLRHTHLADPESSVEEHLFEIVGHYNAAADAGLLRNADEQFELAALNHRAAKKAQEASAYLNAARFAATAIRHLDENAWIARYEMCYELHVLQAECEYLAGNFETCETLLELTLKNASNPIDRCRVYDIKVVQLTNQGKLPEAVAAGAAGLRAMGLRWSRNPSLARVLREVLAARWYRGRKKIADLAELPEMRDPEKLMVMRLLNSLNPSAYSVNQNYFALIVAHGVVLSFKYGMAANSAYLIALFAALIGSQLGQYQDGEAYGRLALRVNERFDDRKDRGRVFFAVGAFVLFWTRPYREALELLRSAHRSAVETGDIIFSSYAGAGYAYKAILTATDFRETLPVVRHYFDYVLKVKDDYIRPLLTALHQLVKNQLGLTNAAGEFSDAEFDEQNFETQLRANQNVRMNWYYTNKAKALFHAGEYDAALKYIHDAWPTMNSSFALPIWVDQRFYEILIRCARDSNVGIYERWRSRRIIRAHLSKLRGWSRNCPENFARRYHLACAEFYRVRAGIGRAARRAIHHYDQALVVDSHDANDVGDAALAFELAGRYYHEQTGPSAQQLARGYLLEARARYDRLGTVVRIQRLDRMYPALRSLRQTAALARSGEWTAQTTGTETTTGTVHAPALDFNSVTRAAHAIAGEIFLDRLLEKLMQLLMENAGAGAGCLILERDGEFLIEAARGMHWLETAREDNEATVLQGLAITEARLPVALIQYVRRTGEPLVLENAATTERFSRSEYIQRVRPKSVLCTPITHQGRVAGLLYLENNLVVGAFTPDRLQVIHVLSTQAAIALQNARLVAEETERQKDRKEMEIARTVQTQVLPRFPEDDVYIFSAHMTPAEQVGGDYYDFERIDSTRWFAIGDVTGHGLHSGLMMLMAQTAFGTYLSRERAPDVAELFCVMNSILHKNIVDRTRQNLFMTCTTFCADDDGLVRFAGKHEDIMVYRAARNTVERIPTDGVWLAMVADVTEMTEIFELRLEPGDIMVLYTDGVIECRNAEGEQFDRERLMQIIQTEASRGVEPLRDAIVRACFDFMARQEDDLTLMIAGRRA